MELNRVILVDDDPFFLKVLGRQLSSLGTAGVVPCGSGEDAITIVEQQPEDGTLLFLDLNMPGMDGIEFVRRLAGCSYSGVLVMMSGEEERILETAVLLARAHRLQVLDPLTKPVDIAGLQRLLQHVATLTPPARQPARKRYGADELRHAIERLELENFYQPKVDVRTGAPVGVEALVRWRHPVEGLVLPGQFIPAAEEHGLIHDITREVLSTALAQVRQWRDKGFRLPVSVNISMANFTSLEFADLVVAELNRHAVPAEDLVLELTESTIMGDARVPLDILTRLRLRRISLSIDDFGTGHSSLTQLRDLPFDELKIDGGFVHGAGEDHTRRAIFAASLDLARQLGMRTVAEGVEDQADWAFVRGNACDLAQGYFLAPPLPAEAIPGWLEGRSPVLPPN